MSEKIPMSGEMRCGYECAIRDAEEQMAKYLGPIHAARIAVRKLLGGNRDERGFLVGEQYDHRGLRK
jgi:hypothetical protein